MLFHPLFLVLTSTLNTVYSLLPVWSFHFGSGCGDGAACDPGTSAAGGDGGALHWFVNFLGVLDRFIPVHDALLPILALSFAITLGLLIFKGVKWLLSLIPTISSAG